MVSFCTKRLLGLAKSGNLLPTARGVWESTISTLGPRPDKAGGKMNCDRMQGADSAVGRGPRQKIMVMNPERVAYAGLLGSPSVREMGTLTIYASLGNPLSISREDGKWESVDFAVVPPYVRHRVATNDRIIGVLMVEPETVTLDEVSRLLQGDQEGAGNMSARIRDTFSKLVGGKLVQTEVSSLDIDGAFFGRPLPSRKIDSRIAKVVNRIRSNPGDQLSAQDCAALTGLSFSRFLHLFRDEVGTTYRRFRAWKRARSLLAYVNGEPNLTDVALEIGYPDSTHFSHSIRHVYGLKPRDIFAGSRSLAVVLQAERGPSPALRLA